MPHFSIFLYEGVGCLYEHINTVFLYGFLWYTLSSCFWGCKMMFLSILAHSQSGTLTYLFPCKPKGFSVQQLLIAGKTAFHWTLLKLLIVSNIIGFVFPLMVEFQVTCMDAVMICVHWHSFSEVFIRQSNDFIFRIVRIWCNVAQEPELWNQSVLWIFYWRIVHIPCYFMFQIFIFI